MALVERFNVECVSQGTGLYLDRYCDWSTNPRLLSNTPTSTKPRPTLKRTAAKSSASSALPARRTW
jgi:hypothetical protein